MKCEICKKEITNSRDSHNGEPLVKGRVCDDCNWKVIKKRLQLAKENQKKSSTESATSPGAISLQGGPIPTADPNKDFERYAKQFKETFIIGETPVRKETAKNNIKVDSKGNFTGEVSSMEKSDKQEQIEPKSATEGISINELQEIAKICSEIGVTTLVQLNKLVKESGEKDALTALRKHKEALGKDFKIKK